MTTVKCSNKNCGREMDVPNQKVKGSVFFCSIKCAKEFHNDPEQMKGVKLEFTGSDPRSGHP